ncbi:MAG: UDP-N-acetylmuramoyl-L-alanyl-D-glutamate--2,6-diaminopimelate ligase [Treponema sp.]|jgi:UDP-N-acetylmuramoyl-L-alanyl-D-glutamate--2,6-diaminopimelate ligase|nr:UDP-N-acetylmuramoyl-L-alanyl-D-glutamate--2,6-diaminopimelate ligase [Treponema sp.]
MERFLSHFLSPDVAQKAGYIGSSPLLPQTDPLITGLAYDSRTVSRGSLYFALPGLHADGHAFIPDAIQRGAKAIIHQHELPEYVPGIPYIRVKDSRFAMSPVAAAFYEFPSQRLCVIGVTGTEGKSTTVYLIYQILRLLGKQAGFISTVQYDAGTGEQWNPEHQTTPEAPVLQKVLRDIHDHGGEYAVLEASSHGLSPRTNRLGDVAFDVGVMTNVTQEHLEFHGTWEQYRQDKARLFQALEQVDHHKTRDPKALQDFLRVPSFGVVNADDPSAGYFAGSTKHSTYTYSTKGLEADLTLKKITGNPRGNWYEVCIHKTGAILDIRDRLPGTFNAGNVLASLLTLSELLSVPVQELIPLVPRLKPVRGRMTTIERGQPFEVMVDYAHTPSSFQTIFPPLRERLDSRGGRIISLFGSAGERDTAKRAEQGKIAAAWSDMLVLTDEDPRGEDPMAILEAIAQGISEAKAGENLFLIPDRPLAIRKAFSLARPKDLVLLLGKGHENSIIYAHETKAYDEIREAEKALAEFGFSQTDDDLRYQVDQARS